MLIDGGVHKIHLCALFWRWHMFYMEITEGRLHTVRVDSEPHTSQSLTKIVLQALPRTHSQLELENETLGIFLEILL